MNPALFLYLTDLSSNLKGFLGFALLMYGTIGLVIGAMSHVEQFEIPKYLIWPKTFAVLLAMAIALPSEKTMYLMAGASIAQTVADNPRAQSLADKAMNSIEKRLDEYLKEETK